MVPTSEHVFHGSYKLIAGLEELERSQRRSALRNLRGKIRFDLDLDKTRR